VPAYQEEARVASTVRRVQEYASDVVVIDDGSSDRTADVAEEAGAIVLRHDGNRGKGVALQTGFAYVREQGFELVITLDADGQHDPAAIPDFLATYEQTGFPVLIGNRMGDKLNMPLVRRWTNMFMSWLLSRQIGQRVPDTQCGYRLYRCAVIPLVSSEAPGYAAESEILFHLARGGAKMGAVPLSAIYNDEESKIHPVRDTIRFFAFLRILKRQ
jgi:glycosyltransferase involved in cell wall biosynthesis